MSKVKISIWDRMFELSVCNECYPGEVETEEQKQALELLLSADSEIEKSKTKVVQYISEINPEEFNGVNMDNLFRFVMPKSIYILRENCCALILCDYKFDVECGIALVFEKGKFKNVCSQDIAL